MQPVSSKPVQQRLKRFIRQPEKLEGRQLTEKGLEAAAIIERYRLISTSLLVRLMSSWPKGARNNYRHLQTLFHKGLINRFALPTTYGTPGEFVYYLDSVNTLRLLVDRGIVGAGSEGMDRREEQIRLNREKGYHQLHKDPDQQGKLLYIQHELMVSRFHALLELGARKTNGAVELLLWKQGPELWSRIEARKVQPVRRDEVGRTVWEEQDESEFLPHRPDAYFALRFAGKPQDQQTSCFLYEADRGTENTTRMKNKLRGHYHFIVKHNRNRLPPYNAQRIRAVLIETSQSGWDENLKAAAMENIVAPKASPLFWFTNSSHFTALKTVSAAGKTKQLPRYLQEPEAIYQRIWRGLISDKPYNLAD